MIVLAMKLGVIMIAAGFGAVLWAATASACGYHGAPASQQSQASSSQMNTTTATTTGKTTGG